MARANAAQIFAVSVGVMLPIFLFIFFAVGTDVYAVARRGLCIVLGNDYVTTSRGNTAALFCLPRSLTQHAPCFPFPFLALVAGSQVVSSGDEAPSSRAVRPSTRSRRGRRRSGHSPFTMPFLLLLVPLLHYGEGKRCSNVRRWGRRYDAVSTAVDAAINRT